MRRGVLLVVVAAALAASCDDAPPPTTTPEMFLRSLKPTLDPKAPGPAEFPGDLLPMPFLWIRWTIAAAGVAVAAALLLRRRARAPAAQPAPVAVAPPPAPHERALRRLAELRARRPRTSAEVDAWYVETSTVVRDYAAERFDVRAAQMTSEQLVAAMETSRRPRLADVLARCDAVKFACDVPGADDAERLLASAETFVAETTSAGGAA